MSDNNTTMQEQQEATEAPTVQDIPEVETPNAEAAKYRTRLREAEAQRDALLAELGDYRRAAIEKAAAGSIEAPVQGVRMNDTPESRAYYMNLLGEVPWLHPHALKHPEDLFTIGGVTHEDLMDDEGRPDPDKVGEALQELFTRRPDLFKNLSSGVIPTVGKVPEYKEPNTLWEDILTGRKHS